MSNKASYRVIGMDCASDAAEIETAVRSVEGVEGAKVSAATHILRLHTSPDLLPRVEGAVRALGYQLTRIDSIGTDPDPSKQSDILPAYRRALWTVVILDVGYGVVEMVGGFLADSQA